MRTQKFKATKVWEITLSRCIVWKGVIDNGSIKKWSWKICVCFLHLFYKGWVALTLESYYQSATGVKENGHTSGLIFKKWNLWTHSQVVAKFSDKGKYTLKTPSHLSCFVWFIYAYVRAVNPTYQRWFVKVCFSLAPNKLGMLVCHVKVDGTNLWNLCNFRMNSNSKLLLYPAFFSVNCQGTLPT